MWNSYFYLNSPEKDKNIFTMAITLFAVWMTFDVAARLLYGKTESNKLNKNVILASDKVCTKKQKTHLYWEWTSANFGEYNATVLSYLMIWFIPALFSEKFRMVSVLMMGFAAFAATFAYLNGEMFTFPSLWCYISVPIFMCVFFKFIFIDK